MSTDWFDSYWSPCQAFLFITIMLLFSWKKWGRARFLNPIAKKTRSFCITAASITYIKLAQLMGRYSWKPPPEMSVLHVIHVSALLSSVPWCLSFISELVAVVDWFAMAFRTFLLRKVQGMGMRAGASGRSQPSASRQQELVWFTPRLLCCGARDYWGARLQTSARCDVFLANSGHCTLFLHFQMSYFFVVDWCGDALSIHLGNFLSWKTVSVP